MRSARRYISYGLWLCYPLLGNTCSGEQWRTRYACAYGCAVRVLACMRVRSYLCKRAEGTCRHMSHMSDMPHLFIAFDPDQNHSVRADDAHSQHLHCALGAGCNVRTAPLHCHVLLHVIGSGQRRHCACSSTAAVRARRAPHFAGGAAQAAKQQPQSRKRQLHHHRQAELVHANATSLGAHELFIDKCMHTCAGT